jgi:hypothetical protein
VPEYYTGPKVAATPQEDYLVAAAHVAFSYYDEGIIEGVQAVSSDVHIASGDGLAEVALSSLVGGSRFPGPYAGASSLLIPFPLEKGNGMVIAYHSQRRGAGWFNVAVRVTHTAIEQVSLSGFPSEELYAPGGLEASPGYNFNAYCSSVSLFPTASPSSTVRNAPSGVVYYGGFSNPVIGTPAVHLITQVLKGGDRDTLIAAAPRRDLWFPPDGWLKKRFKVKPGTAIPAEVPAGTWAGFDSSWAPILSWDGGAGAYCNAQLAALGYTP